jgi:hypothetical protein
MLCLLLVARAPASSAAEISPSELLAKIRVRVLEQVRIGGNYMCVQTADRHYFRPKKDSQSGCEPLKNSEKMIEFLSDRLRLEVAVSENNEIYSWYGQQHFHSGGIEELITTGPITSGGFGGFLRNVFLVAGVVFTYSGHSDLNGVPEDSFDYKVPLPRSNYAIATSRGQVLVAFNGSFAANSNTLELTKLVVEVPQPPRDSNVCSALSSIDYQVAHISGNDVLIPSRFDLKIDDAEHITTDTQFEYKSCHAFTGESTISFAMGDPANLKSDSAKPVVKGPLPPNLDIPIELSTPIDSRTSYTGDPIEGIVTRAIKLDRSGEVIPKGALVSGLITQLEFHRNPGTYYLLDVLFNKIIDGNVIYTMQATHLSTPGDVVTQGQFRGRGNRGIVVREKPLTPAALLETGSRFHLNSGYKAEWRTKQVEPHKTGEP